MLFVTIFIGLILTVIFVWTAGRRRRRRTAAASMMALACLGVVDQNVVHYGLYNVPRLLIFSFNTTFSCVKIAAFPESPQDVVQSEKNKLNGLVLNFVSSSPVQSPLSLRSLRPSSRTVDCQLVENPTAPLWSFSPGCPRPVSAQSVLSGK